MSQVPWGTTQPCQNLGHLPPGVENTLVYMCRPHWESPAEGRPRCQWLPKRLPMVVWEAAA